MDLAEEFPDGSVGLLWSSTNDISVALCSFLYLMLLFRPNILRFIFIDSILDVLASNYGLVHLKWGSVKKVWLCDVEQICNLNEQTTNV